MNCVKRYSFETSVGYLEVLHYPGNKRYDCLDRLQPTPHTVCRSLAALVA